MSGHETLNQRNLFNYSVKSLRGLRLRSFFVTDISFYTAGTQHECPGHTERNRRIMSIRVIQESRSWIAVYKPAGLAVQTGRIGETDLESELRKYLAGGRHAEEKNRREQPPYLAVIHRLDQPGEGIVLFAKNPRAAASLSSQLQQHIIRKEYLACVHAARDAQISAGHAEDAGAGGRPEQQTCWYGLCDWLIRDGKTNLSRVTAAGTKGAKKAELEYRILSESDDTAVLEIRLHTGRHHQIRVQLAHAGMPIIGDRKYGDGFMPAGCHFAASSFPALCAWHLSFTDPDSGKNVTLKVKPENLLLI